MVLIKVKTVLIKILLVKHLSHEGIVFERPDRYDNYLPYKQKSPESLDSGRIKIKCNFISLKQHQFQLLRHYCLTYQML